MRRRTSRPADLQATDGPSTIAGSVPENRTNGPTKKSTGTNATSLFQLRHSGSTIVHLRDVHAHPVAGLVALDVLDRVGTTLRHRERQEGFDQDEAGGKRGKKCGVVVGATKAWSALSAIGDVRLSLIATMAPWDLACSTAAAPSSGRDGRSSRTARPRRSGQCHRSADCRGAASGSASSAMRPVYQKNARGRRRSQRPRM